MADSTDTQADFNNSVVMTEEERIALEERKAARRWQYSQEGGRIDTTMGNMGGAGAAASGPDIAKLSRPMPGNSSDERSR
jgi:hypothetical protein